MPDFLMEVLSEEVPANLQTSAGKSLEEIVKLKLSDLGLVCGGSEAHATPRRMCLHMRGLPRFSPERTIERKGPRVEASLQAKQGFARSSGVAPDQLEIRDLKKRLVLLCPNHTAGQTRAANIVRDPSGNIGRIPLAQINALGKRGYSLGAADSFHTLLAV